MSYIARFAKDNSACDGGNSAEDSGSSKGPDEVSNDFDHEIAQLTKHKSRPHQLLSGDMPGKLRLPVSTMKMLVGRESNHSGRGRFSSADCCHALSRYLPVNGPWGVDQSRSPAYVSQFSNDGLFFVAGFQGRHIRINNVEKGWKVQKDILTKSSRWTITDTSLSLDQRYPVRLVGGCYDDVRQKVDAGESVAAVTWVSEKSTAKSKHDGSSGITGCAQDDNDFFF